MGRSFNKYKVMHGRFNKMMEGFKDCVRYSNATVLEYSEKESFAIIEIPPSGNRAMRKEWIDLYVKRWESFGFSLEEIK